jgi:hypothetical protein
MVLILLLLSNQTAEPYFFDEPGDNSREKPNHLGRIRKFFDTLQLFLELQLMVVHFIP